MAELSSTATVAVIAIGDPNFTASTHGFLDEATCCGRRCAAGAPAAAAAGLAAKRKGGFNTCRIIATRKAD